MIKTKEELKAYLYADASRYGQNVPSFKDFLLHNEKWFAFRLVRRLRYVEYYRNTNSGGVKNYCMF